MKRRASKKTLTCSTGSRTVELEQGNNVDATARSLMKQLRELETQKWAISRDIDAINRALTMAGVKPTREVGGHQEAEYAVKQPFTEMRLSEACAQILRDYSGQWLTKSQVEYLLVRGGCPFSTDERKNSVDVTLRRLADQNLCMAERAMGSRGNKYRHIEESTTGGYRPGEKLKGVIDVSVNDSDKGTTSATKTGER